MSCRKCTETKNEIETISRTFLVSLIQTGCFSKANEPSLPDNLAIVGGRRDSCLFEGYNRKMKHNQSRPGIELWLPISFSTTARSCSIKPVCDPPCDKFSLFSHWNLGAVIVCHCKKYHVKKISCLFLRKSWTSIK